MEPFYVKLKHHVGHGCWHLTGPSIMVSSAFHLCSYSPAKSLSWWPDSSHSNNYTVCVTVMSTQEPLVEKQRHLLLSQTWVSVMFTVWPTNCMRQRLKLRMGLPWLSRPVATVTDVLFNTRAGSSYGWSEYKLARCLQEGECTANVALHMQAHPFKIEFGASSVFFSLFHRLFVSWSLKKTITQVTQRTQQICVMWIR